MSAVASLSPLDSERFQIRVGRADGVTAATVPDLLQFIDDEEVAMMVARCGGADQMAAKAMLESGFTMLETQITYQGAPMRHPTQVGIRRGTPDDAESVEALARDGFRNLAGHYHADPRLDPADSTEIYVDWTRRGLAGEAADLFLVAEAEGKLAGFGFFTISGTEVTYQLSTVARWAHGLGLYSSCLREGMNWGLDRGAEVVFGTISHGNIPPQRNLLALEMRPVSATSTFHGWSDSLVRS